MVGKHNTKQYDYMQEARKLVRGQLSQGYELEALHTYTALNGEPIFWRIRLRNSEGKLIFPIHKIKNGNFVLKEPDFKNTKPIYRLHELAENLSDSVYVVEGEACADKLVEYGLRATTSGSWNSAKSADWSKLKGRPVIIWRDADEAGFKFAKQVTEILLKLGCSVQWIDVEKLNPPDGGDCIDWFIDHPDALKEDVHKLTLIEPPLIIGACEPDVLSRNYPRFESRESGVFYCKDENDSFWICSWLEVKALTRDSDGINWGRVLEFKDADQVVRSWTMPMELLGGNGDELAKELFRLGLRIAPGSAMRRLLVEYITNSETSSRARCVLRTGWHEKCFVLPHKVFGGGNESILLQTDTHITSDYCATGDLLSWQKNISSLCVGNSRLTFAASLAFAPPLLKIVRAESGGFHFRGESSTGKTTALLVSASVWGGSSYVQSWRVTDNGLEGLAAQYNDTLLPLDELSQIDPKHAGEVAYMLANGQGKARASKSGFARQRHNWRLLFLSNGEISLSSHMLEVGKKSKAGQEVRMVDIPADAGVGKGIFETTHDFPQSSALAEYLKVTCDQYHGTPSEKFLEKLVLTEELLLHTKIQNLQKDFMQSLPLDTHGQVKRVAQRFSLVAATGEIATEFGVTGWQPGAAIHAAKRCFEAWLSSRDGGVGSHEHEATLEQVRHFFQENASRFDTYDNEKDYADRLIPSRCAGFRGVNGDFYVYPKTFTGEVCKGLGSPKDVARIVEKCGWLLLNAKEKTPYSSVWVPTQNKTIRLYHFSSKVIGESDKK